MTYIVQDRIEIAIYIDNKEYPLSSTNTLNYLHIGSTARGKFPTVHFSITDVDRVLDVIGLQDGIPMLISVKSNQDDAEVFKFRKFHHKKEFNGAAYVYYIDGYYDNPLWFSGTRSGSMTGSSNVVLQNIAAQVGLKYDGVVTSDSQIWLPQNAVWSDWAKTIAASGYVSQTSCMALALDLDGTLRYRDVNNLQAPPKRIVAYQYAEDAYTAVDFLGKAVSGFNNAKTGYWDTRVQQSAISGTPSVAHNKLSFTSDSRSPLFNTKMKDATKAGAVKYGPVDVGNVHTNSERAVYQNIRYKNMFSFGLQMLMALPTKVKIFDRINFYVEKDDSSQDISVSGLYIVTGRAIFVRGANYSEKIEAVRHGTNEKYVSG